MHNSFTWGEAAALLRVSGRTVTHAARVLSEDSPAAPAVRLAVEQGRVTVSDASRVIDEPTEVQLRALERVTGGGSRNLARRGAGAAPGGLRWWPRLSAVLGRPHGGSGERRHEGSHQPRGHGGRCGGGGVRSGRRRRSPWGLAGAFSGLDIASALLRLRGGSVARVGRRPGPPYIPSPGGPEKHGEPLLPSFPPFLRPGIIMGLKTALQAILGLPGSSSRELLRVAFRAGLAQVQPGPAAARRAGQCLRGPSRGAGVLGLGNPDAHSSTTSSGTSSVVSPDRPGRAHG